MDNVQTEIQIQAPREDVAAYASDPKNAPQWYRNIDSARWLSEPPLRVGSPVAFSAQFLGRTLDYSYEIVELVPGERLLMRTSQGPFPMQTTYTWHDAGDGTGMTLCNSGNPAGSPLLPGPSWALSCAGQCARTWRNSSRSLNPSYRVHSRRSLYPRTHSAL